MYRCEAVGVVAEPTTFIKLDRNILEWRWFKDQNTYKLFTYFLIKANVTDQPWQDIVIGRGQLVTSFTHMAQETGLSVRSVRTSLDKLKSTSEVTCASSSKYTVITVINYDKYQNSARRTTSDRQTSDKPATNDRQQYKNDKNVKNEKEIGGASLAGPPPKGTPEYDAWRNQ